MFFEITKKYSQYGSRRLKSALSSVPSSVNTAVRGPLASGTWSMQVEFIDLHISFLC
jgi:hypothetical protein